MKRLLLALLPWMAMTSAVRAQTPADVVFTHLGLINQRAMRVDDECFVPLEFLKSVGWSYAGKGESIEVRTEQGRVNVSVRDIAGRSMIPLHQLMDKLGGETSWDGDQFLALAPLDKVQIRKGRFTIDAALPVKAHVELMDEPNRVVVDIQGAKLTRKTQVDLDGISRISQFKRDVVRVVLETDFNPAVKPRDLTPSRSLEFNVDLSHERSADPSPKQVSDKISQVPGPKVPLTQPQPIQYDPASNPDFQPAQVPAAMPNSTVVGPLSIDSDSGRVTGLTLKVVGGMQKMPTFRRPQADVIEIVIPGAKPADDVDFKMVKGPTIKDVDVRDESGSMVIALSLVRPMGIEFSLSSVGLQIQLIKPNVGNGHLAGKLIVVDAGHGGHDAGTQSAGLSEKDFTLSIAKLLSSKLSDEGATVVMTRKTDVFIPLSERPAIANRNGADFFVSVHINSNELDNTASGTITFFHARDPICQLMADCIQREIVKVSGLPGMGVWSDQRIYQSGFAVLRGAKMPAVLIECGFLNTKKDRARMLTDDFQNGVAGAVVKGLKAYLGDEKTK